MGWVLVKFRVFLNLPNLLESRNPQSKPTNDNSKDQVNATYSIEVRL